jgi:hypothetical protein
MLLIARSSVCATTSEGVRLSAETGFTDSSSKAESAASSLRSAGFKLSESRLVAGPGPGIIKQAQPAGRHDGKLVSEVDMSTNQNAQLKTKNGNMKFATGKKTSVWMSVSFDRPQAPTGTPNAYIAILEDAKNPLYFSVLGLLSAPASFSIGAEKYSLSMNPVYTDFLKSQVTVTNAATAKKTTETFGKMMSAIHDVGASVVVNGKSYGVFYCDDVNPKGQPVTRSFLFFYVDSTGQNQIATVPAEIVPDSGVPAMFQMLNGQTLGLLQPKGKKKLQIFASVL